MSAAAVFLPLVGAFIAGVLALVGRDSKTAKAGIDRAAQLVTCFLMLMSAVFGCFLFYTVVVLGNQGTATVFTWLDSGSMEFSWALRLDTLSAVMLATVTITSAMIHIYSIGYMHHDPGKPRFMSYLSLFTFFMLMLVTADNLLQLFFGWEGVGLCSYLLIGFWYDRPSANRAAIKAFIVNRVGDIAFVIGIVAIYLLFDSVAFDAIFAAAPGKADATMNVFGGSFHAMTVICLLLFVGAMGKSAQIGLHVWLPDAMEGPTPVSALIHAATMVTAGVFMVARMSPLFELSTTALAVVTIVGGSTAIFAATIACVQTDIKRVIAYSTCSQLGYMFFACGVSAYAGGIFHLMTHAYFKSLLFLGAGSVIHAMSDEQDMRRMGGLANLIPTTYVLMWIGSLALAGVFPFSGFYSKDVVIEAAYAAGTAVGDYAFWVGILAAFLTAFYSWRLLFMTFHGKPRMDETTLAHVHESPPVMLWPLFVLAAGATLAGFLAEDAFVGHESGEFWRGSILVAAGHDALTNAHGVPPWVVWAPTAVGIAGIALAFLFYIAAPSLPGRLAAAFSGVHRFLINKWYFDEIYDAVFVRPAMAIGRGLWKIGDGAIIDGLGPDGIAARTVAIARWVAARQTGYIYHYAFAMLSGVVILVSWYLFQQVG